MHTHTRIYIEIPADTYIDCMYKHVSACIECICRNFVGIACIGVYCKYMYVYHYK